MFLIVHYRLGMKRPSHRFRPLFKYEPSVFSNRARRPSMSSCSLLDQDGAYQRLTREEISLPLQLVGTSSRAIRRRTSKEGANVKTGELIGKASAPIVQERVRRSS